MVPVKKPRDSENSSSKSKPRRHTVTLPSDVPRGVWHHVRKEGEATERMIGFRLGIGGEIIKTGMGRR